METIRNYRITVLSVDKKYVTKFQTQGAAMSTIMTLKEVDENFLAGILEKKRSGKWEIIWSLK